MEMSGPDCHQRAKPGPAKQRTSRKDWPADDADAKRRRCAQPRASHFKDCREKSDPGDDLGEVPAPWPKRDAQKSAGKGETKRRVNRVLSIESDSSRDPKSKEDNRDDQQNLQVTLIENLSAEAGDELERHQQHGRKWTKRPIMRVTIRCRVIPDSTWRPNKIEPAVQKRLCQRRKLLFGPDTQVQPQRDCQKDEERQSDRRPPQTHSDVDLAAH